jgi:hypothetical protein
VDKFSLSVIAVTGLYFVYWVNASIFNQELIDPFRNARNTWEHFLLWGIFWAAVFTVIGGFCRDDDEPR